MTIEIQDKQIQCSLTHLHVEGMEQGLTEDLTYRPNKYFHPIEAITRPDPSKLCLLYKKQIHPIQGDISRLQIMQVLQGVIQAQEQISTDQVFYLYPGKEAFCLDRRKNLKVCLINVRPHKDAECHPQEMSVDAFVQLLAQHCPKAHRKIVNYNKPILTLKQLQQLLESRSASILATTTTTILVLFIVAFGLLHQFGPPRIKLTLQEWTNNIIRTSKRLTRSGTAEWFAQIRKERIEREYRYPPLSLTLILQPQTRTDEERQNLFQSLNRILTQEFPKAGSYQLLIPSPTLSATAHTTWKRLCQHALKKAPCDPKNWLLQINQYKGGLRPLLHALKELAQQKKPNTPTLHIQHLQFIGAARLSLHKTPAKTSPKNQP